jgi:DNA-binding NtrC family response regulator
MVADPSTVGVRDRVRVLVSDQDAGAREALKQSLEPRCWELYEVNSGREALRVFRTHVVHVLVSAVELPDTTGFHLARELRHVVVGLPFVLTAYDLSKEMLLRALMARAFTVLQKPIDGWMFRTTLEHLVGRCYRSGVPTVWEESRNSWRESAREEELL